MWSPILTHTLLEGLEQDSNQQALHFCRGVLKLGTMLLGPAKPKETSRVCPSPSGHMEADLTLSLGHSETPASKALPPLLHGHPRPRQSPALDKRGGDESLETKGNKLNI